MSDDKNPGKKLISFAQSILQEEESNNEIRNQKENQFHYDMCKSIARDVHKKILTKPNFGPDVEEFSIASFTSIILGVALTIGDFKDLPAETKSQLKEYAEQQTKKATKNIK